jgi:hypothetical protein
VKGRASLLKALTHLAVSSEFCEGKNVGEAGKAFAFTAMMRGARRDGSSCGGRCGRL